jgi:hypothetical protein
LLINNNESDNAVVEQWRSSDIRWSAFFFRRKLEMSKSQTKSAAGKIFDNILFLAEVFGDQAERDIPKLPVLEMAQCFDLEIASPSRASRRRSKAWPLWK